MTRPMLLLHAALAALALAALPAHAQSARSDAPLPRLETSAAGVLASAIVDAVNDADTTAIPRLLDRTLSADSRQPRAEILDVLRACRDQGGGDVGSSRVTPRGSAVRSCGRGGWMRACSSPSTPTRRTARGCCASTCRAHPPRRRVPPVSPSSGWTTRA